MTITTDDENRPLYNHLYAPDGSSSVVIEPNRIAYFIYIKAVNETNGRWLSHIG